MLYGRRLLILVQSDDPKIQFGLVGGEAPMWNRREWSLKDRGLETELARPAFAYLRVSAVLELEKHTPAVEHGRLVENIGIDTLGGVFTPLLTRGQSVPCEVTETFGMFKDNQDRIQVRLFRGTSKLVEESTLIGRFTIEGLPKRPRGTVQVAVRFSVTSDGDIVVATHEIAVAMPHHFLRAMLAKWSIFLQSGQPVRLVRDDR
jgi:hypothetical protein